MYNENIKMCSEVEREIMYFTLINDIENQIKEIRHKVNFIISPSVAKNETTDTPTRSELELRLFLVLNHLQELKNDILS